MLRRKLRDFWKNLSFLYVNRQVLCLAFCVVLLYWFIHHNFNQGIGTDLGSSTRQVHIEIFKPNRFPMVLRLRSESDLELIKDMYNLPQKPRNGDKLILGDNGHVELARMSGFKGLSLGVPIGINTASEEDLALLPGIGVKLAERIVDWRTANRSFANIEELDKVEGIGKKKMQALKPLVSLD